MAAPGLRRLYRARPAGFPGRCQDRTRRRLLGLCCPEYPPVFPLTKPILSMSPHHYEDHIGTCRWCHATTDTPREIELGLCGSCLASTAPACPGDCATCEQRAQ